MTTVVIGVGNEFRRDDGVGLVVAAHLARLDLPGVAVRTSNGEPVQLLEAWFGADLAIIVDAVLCDPPTPGRIRTAPLAQLPTQNIAASTHAFGIADALRLGQAVDRVPAHALGVAVEVADVGFGVGLSPAVAAVVPAAVREVRRMITNRAAARQVTSGSIVIAPQGHSATHRPQPLQ
jgi:hydrogenase maturation protease